MRVENDPTCGVLNVLRTFKLQNTYSQTPYVNTKHSMNRTHFVCSDCAEELKMGAFNSTSLNLIALNQTALHVQAVHLNQSAIGLNFIKFRIIFFNKRAFKCKTIVQTQSVLNTS